MNEIFEKLAATASRNEKIAILKQNDSPILRKILHMALDPFTQFYVRKIPQYEQDRVQYDLEEALTELTRLSSRQVTGNAAIAHLQHVLSSVRTGDAKVIERVIQKDLKCGVAATSINKALGFELIHEYPVMLCSPSDDKVLAKFEFPAIVQTKMDGMRFNAIVKDGKVELRSRNGKFIDLFGTIEPQFYQLAIDMGMDSVVFDGELLIVENGTVLDRQTGNGILNKAVKGTIELHEAQNVQATIWDVIPYDVFTGTAKSAPYGTRFASLKLVTLPPKINLVNTYFVTSVREATKLFEQELKNGQEGIIMKETRGLWENKRVKHQIKFKAELTADLECVRWIPGTGKYVGMMGALTLRTADGLLTVDVGTGFTDAQRAAFTEKTMVGKIIEVKYNAKITDKNTGNNSLFLPVFLGVRDDKLSANTFSELS